MNIYYLTKSHSLFPNKPLNTYYFTRGCNYFKKPYVNLSISPVAPKDAIDTVLVLGILVITFMVINSANRRDVKNISKPLTEFTSTKTGILPRK